MTVRWVVSLNLIWASLGKGSASFSLSFFFSETTPTTFVTERIVRMPGPSEPGRDRNGDWTMGKATGMADGEVHERYLAEEAESWTSSTKTSSNGEV